MGLKFEAGGIYTVLFSQFEFRFLVSMVLTIGRFSDQTETTLSIKQVVCKDLLRSRMGELDVPLLKNASRFTLQHTLLHVL